MLPLVSVANEKANGGCVMKKRITRVLRLCKKSMPADERGGGALVQVWVPAAVHDGERH